MNALDRVRRAVAFESIDRFPVFPITIASSCELTGTPQGRYSKDANVLAETLLAVRDMFDFDGVYVSRDNWVFHEAFGGAMEFPEDDEPNGRGPLLAEPSEFRRLTLPDPERAPGTSTLLAAARQVVAAVGERCYVQANIDSGPFSVAAELLGLEHFLLVLSTVEAGEIEEFLEFCTDVVVAYGRAMAATGVHGIQYGDACAGLVGPQMYRRFVLPYQQRTVEELGGEACDLWIHICGRTTHILPLVATLAIDGFEIDAQVPLAEGRTLLGKRIALKGNLDTTFLLSRTPEEVHAETTRMLADYGAASGLVVSPGCGVPRMTPRENLSAMVEACRDFALR